MKRLTPATLTLVMFGILGLLVVGYVAKSLLAVPEKKVVAAVRDIPMAITDIAPGTILTDKHLGLGKIPVADLTREMLLTNRVIVGRVVKTPLKAAEPIKANQLFQHGERPPLVLANGMRAVTVQVGDGASMVDGMIKPGDHVDVLFTTMSGGGSGSSDLEGGLTMRLFEGVKILAINGSSTQAGVDRGSNYVTLELTEPQTNIVVLAHDKGKITLTFNPSGKGNGGVSLTNTERITFYEILGLRRGEAPKPPFTTEIFRGPARSTLVFDDKGRFLGSRAPNPTNTTPQYVLPPTSGTGPNADPSPGPGPTPGLPAPTTALPPQTQDNPNQPRLAPTASLLQILPN